MCLFVFSALDSSGNAAAPSCAVFYSVNSPHVGLSKYSHKHTILLVVLAYISFVVHM